MTIEYKPGDILKEVEISDIVTPMSLNDYIKIFQIRENLELLSVKLATLNCNEENILALEENCELQKKSLYKKVTNL